MNELLQRSRAEWISPGYDDEIFAEVDIRWHPARRLRWYADPPPADGTKIILSDTDHYAPGSKAMHCGRGRRSCAVTIRS